MFDSVVGRDLLHDAVAASQKQGESPMLATTANELTRHAQVTSCRSRQTAGRLRTHRRRLAASNGRSLPDHVLQVRGYSKSPSRMTQLVVRPASSHASADRQPAGQIATAGQLRPFHRPRPSHADSSRPEARDSSVGRSVEQQFLHAAVARAFHHVMVLIFGSAEPLVRGVAPRIQRPRSICRLAEILLGRQRPVLNNSTVSASRGSMYRPPNAR